MIPPGNPRAASSDITIRGEHMTGGTGFQLFVGDVTNLVIADSSLGDVVIAPTARTQGILQSSTYLRLTREQHPGVVIELTTT